jgi:hypothetical protein
VADDVAQRSGQPLRLFIVKSAAGPQPIERVLKPASWLANAIPAGNALSL